MSLSNRIDRPFLVGWLVLSTSAIASVVAHGNNTTDNNHQIVPNTQSLSERNADGSTPRFCRWHPLRDCSDKDHCPADQVYKNRHVQLYHSTWGLDKGECASEFHGWLKEKCTHQIVDWNCHHVKDEYGVIGINVEFTPGYAEDTVVQGCIEESFKGATYFAPNAGISDKARIIKCCNAEDEKCLYDQPGSPFPSPSSRPPRPPPPTVTVTAPPITVTQTTSYTTTAPPGTTIITTSITSTVTTMPSDPPTPSPAPPGELPLCPPLPCKPWWLWCPDKHAWSPGHSQNWGPIGPDGKPCKPSWTWGTYKATEHKVPGE